MKVVTLRGPRQAHQLLYKHGEIIPHLATKQDSDGDSHWDVDRSHKLTVSCKGYGDRRAIFSTISMMEPDS